MGLGTPEDVDRNFVTGNDTANLLGLNGFEVVKQTRGHCFPSEFPYQPARQSGGGAVAVLNRALHDRVRRRPSGRECRRLLRLGDRALLQ